MRRAVIAVIAFVGVAGCGSQTKTATVTKTVSSPESTAPAAHRLPSTPKKSYRSNAPGSPEAPAEVNGVSYECATASKPYCTQGECMYPTKRPCAAGYSELGGAECTRPAISEPSPPPSSSAATPSAAQQPAETDAQAAENGHPIAAPLRCQQIEDVQGPGEDYQAVVLTYPDGSQQTKTGVGCTG